MKLLQFTVFLILLSLIACTPGKDKTEKQETSFKLLENSYNTRYSSKFRIDEFGEFTKATVLTPWPGSNQNFTYFFVSKSSDIDIPANAGDVIIRTPVESIVCFSTTHLPYLEMMGEENKLTGFPTTSLICSQAIRDRVEKGKVVDLGPSNEVNIETVIDLSPEMIVAFSMGDDIGMIKKLQVSGIPVVLNADYLENHPLGRAEWIRFMSLFFEKEKIADSIFLNIERSYLALKHKTDQITDRPTVLSGIVYGDTWFLPGGRNYGARFIQDAGGRYPWSDNNSVESLQLSFESVFEKAHNADLWINVATYDTKQALISSDARYGEFGAYKNNMLFNYTARISGKGGNEFFEKGYARPDIILSDLVKIFHPDLMKDYNLYFYRKLE
ncbi:ABC transporter substrate-binding protein [Bacteroidota bacterium]